MLKIYFLYHEKVRLQQKWIYWINGCISFTLVSIIINGSPSKEFMMQREIRQGDPLASFFFTVVAEGLSSLMREVQSKDLFFGLQSGKKWSGSHFVTIHR